MRPIQLFNGFNLDEIERLHRPVGLYSGAKTPREIALSILAEIAAAKYRVQLVQKRFIPAEQLAERDGHLDTLATQLSGAAENL